MINSNILSNISLNTDGYKFSQYLQYPPNTTVIHSYGESRGSKYTDKMLYAGLQYFIKRNLMIPITHADIDFAAKVVKAYGAPFNEAGWRYIVDNHGGIMPLRIRSIAEGTIVPTGTVLYTIENTDPNCYWLPSYLETATLRAIWYTTTVATNSRICKETIREYLNKTSDNPEMELPFKLHDFGARGVSSEESAGLGGMAHIINFSGSDTITGILYAMQYYDADVSAFGIPASEHSSITSWGRENELDAYQNMVDQYAKPGAIFACVSDSYNIWDACRMWAREGLIDRVREEGATVVIRPDSGDPLTVPLDVIELMMEEVGYTINSKGYKVLPDHVRVIQGDGITKDSLRQILEGLEARGLSASNLTFGMGGGLLQHVNRDDLKFAQKCSAAKVDGEWRDVFKDPVDSPDKKSKRGIYTVIRNIADGRIENMNIPYDILENYEIPEGFEEIMGTVYLNGAVTDKFITFEEIRANSNR